MTELSAFLWLIAGGLVLVVIIAVVAAVYFVRKPPVG